METIQVNTSLGQKLQILKEKPNEKLTIPQLRKRKMEFHKNKPIKRYDCKYIY